MYVHTAPSFPDYPADHLFYGRRLPSDQLVTVPPATTTPPSQPPPPPSPLPLPSPPHASTAPCPYGPGDRQRPGDTAE